MPSNIYTLTSENTHDKSAIDIREVTKVFNSLAFNRSFRILRSSSSKAVVALNQISLTIATGEIFGLIGRNGQGKTTLIKSIASLLLPTHGSITVFDHDTNNDGQSVKSLIGLVSADERTFYGRLTGWQNLLFFARLYGMADTSARRRINELAEIFDFHPMLPRRFQELSSGNKQRMSLIRALLIDPPLILMDEPTRSLDPIAADELRRILHDELNVKQGKTIFITSHNLAEVETLCSRVGFLSRGEVKLCATMEELTNRYFTIERVTLDVQGIPSMKGLSHLVIPLPPLECKMEPTGLMSINFRRKVGDETLNDVIQQILAHGGRIVGCRTDRDGLREIMDTFENNDRI